MIALFVGIFALSLFIFRVEAAELLTITAMMMIRRRQSSLDHQLVARSRPGYRNALR